MKYYKCLDDNYMSFKNGRIYKGDYCAIPTGGTVSTLAERFPKGWEEVPETEYLRQNGILPNVSVNTKPYYVGNNSLYKFAEEWELNSYEFEILKRIVRCRKKGEWLSDLNKTKEVIDIYIKECKDKFKGRDLEISEKF